MDIEDALQCARQFPGIGDKIASVDIIPTSGKVLKTQGLAESHHTWWTEINFDHTEVSQVVRNV